MFGLLEHAGFKRIRSTIVPGFAFRREPDHFTPRLQVPDFLFSRLGGGHEAPAVRTEGEGADGGRPDPMR